MGLLLASTGRPVLLVVAMLIAGFGEGPQLTALFAVRHREAPDHLRGQIFTTGASLKISGFALGAAAAGQIAGASLTAALLVAAGTQVLAALTYWATSRATGRRPPPHAATGTVALAPSPARCRCGLAYCRRDGGIRCARVRPPVTDRRIDDGGADEGRRPQ